MSEVISSFKSLKAGSQVFAFLMLFLCVILDTMWSGKSLQCVLSCPRCPVVQCVRHRGDIW